MERLSFDLEMEALLSMILLCFFCDDKYNKRFSAGSSNKYFISKSTYNVEYSWSSRA